MLFYQLSDIDTLILLRKFYNTAKKVPKTSWHNLLDQDIY